MKAPSPYGPARNLITLPNRQLEVVRFQPAELTLTLGPKSAPAEETGAAAETAVPSAQYGVPPFFASDLLIAQRGFDLPPNRSDGKG